MTAIQVVSLLVEKGLSLEDAASVYEPFPQVLKTVPVLKKVPLGELPRLSRAARKVEEELGRKHGRLLLRYSGTELALRIMLEGPDSDQIEALSVDLLEAVRKDLGEYPT